MTRAHFEDGFDGKTCLCCMCRCGDHKCFQQMASKLPLSMQLELKSKDFESQKMSNKETKVTAADLYRKSTYKKDFCEQQDLIDRYPLEHNKLETHLRLHAGDVAKESTYSNDYIPWSRKDLELYKAKLHVPDYMLQGVHRRDEDCEPRVANGIYNYYCPKHCCIGARKEETKENCLTDYREKFNVGPPLSHEQPSPERKREPFEKFSNYMLDYKGSTIPPSFQRQDRRKDELVLDGMPHPMDSETSYRSAYTSPPESLFVQHFYDGPAKDLRSTLKVGDGPMQGESTAMVDYRDPDVGTHLPTRPAKDVYKPPQCRMETTTTTRSTYPGWKVYPSQAKPKKFTETDHIKEQLCEIQRLVTTYQEDFDGINSGLCPCKTAQNYGPKYLEPRYRFSEADRQHEFFHYNTNFSEPKYKDCFH